MLARSLSRILLVSCLFTLAAALPAGAEQRSAVPPCGVVSTAAHTSTATDPLFSPSLEPRPLASGWTFEGCFTYFPSGPCRDVYRDSAGALWICKACGTTSNPSSKTCGRLSASGYWCS